MPFFKFEFLPNLQKISKDKNERELFAKFKGD